MILRRIADAARLRVAKEKEQIPPEQMREMALSISVDEPFRFQKAFQAEGISFICEVKKASPSKGVIAEDFPYQEIAREYEAAGAAAISVLTEPEFFQGSDQYLARIHQVVNTPLLRKDFTVDPYQIYQARYIGADGILLICALLTAEEIREYLEICDWLKLSALVEAHDEVEVAMALDAGASVIGVNNRDLKTFQVDINNCIRLRQLVPPGITFVAESGVKTPDDVDRLRAAGVDAVLIGETLMRSKDKKGMLDTLRG